MRLPTIIFQLVLIVLLAGVAEAGTTYDPSVKVIMTDEGEIIAACSVQAKSCVIYPPYSDNCKHKMKEAMKLIRPYIDYGDGGTTTDLLYRSPQTKLREEADRLDKRDAAVRRWETIYQECVK